MNEEAAWTAFQNQLWLTAARPVELADSVAGLAALVSHHMPLALLVLRVIDRERCRLETVAAGASGGAEPPRRVYDPVSPNAMDAILRAASGQVGAALRVLTPGDPLAVAAPRGVADQVVGATLVAGGEVLGVLLLVPRRGRRFTAAHVRLAEALVDPCAAALGTHCLLHRIRTQREAAEAARHSLLTRLEHGPPGDVIIGAESGLAEVMESVEQVAHSDLPVLIFGETGSGKEVVARAIHQRSRRARAPFLRVNCGAIPGELVDSELFGHERGSFTGAINLRRGWFERADGGTLLLDEVGELSRPAQVRLLRVLQDGTYERVGGHRQLVADVRVIAATHRDLPRMVADEHFREDLWYRLAVFILHLPPLRERRGDLAALASHFALRASRRFGLPLRLPDRADLDLLAAYRWPGNVRELQAVIDRAAILGNGERLAIGAALGSAAPPAASSDERPPRTSHPEREAIATLDDAMRQHIERALLSTHGRVDGRYGAARILAVNPHTLRARMRRLEIDWRVYRTSE